MKRLIKYFAEKDKPQIEKTLERFESYYEELIKANEKFNLTTILDREEVIIKHFADSLEGLQYALGKVCDLGSGAGFPGIPFALVEESKEIILMDSVLKKVRFLQEIIHIFKLSIQRSIYGRRMRHMRNIENILIR